jgi:hypothetical protein
MFATTRIVRILALKALVDHFPNPSLIARGVERTHDKQTARDFVKEMRHLRNHFRHQLQKIKSTNNTNHT